MPEEYKTAMGLFEYFEKEGLNEIDGVIVAVPWDIPEESYVLGIGKIKPKIFYIDNKEVKGISIKSNDKGYIELIKGKGKKRTNHFDLPSARILYFKEKIDTDTIEEAEKYIKN